MGSVSSVYLAFRDWCHEKLLSACAVLALSSMLVPLLILHGVHSGVIRGLKERLTSDPTVLVIMPESMPPGGFTPTFMNRLRTQAGTQFCIERTRDVAAELQLRSQGGTYLTVTLEPTASGDPVVESAGLSVPKVPQTVMSTGVDAIFSFTAAQKLKLKKGDAVTGFIARHLANGKRERVEFSINVAGILPATSLGMDSLFMPLPLLQAIQDYRDGFGAPVIEIAGEGPPAMRVYESFRLYAKSLDAVEQLHAWLETQNITARTKVREIANIRKLDASLRTVVLIISVTVGAGFLAFMISSMQAAVRRKEKMLGMLRLLGYTSLRLLLYPITQAILTATAGSAIAFLLYAGVAYGIDVLFATQGGGLPICLIPMWHFPVIWLAVVTLSVMSSWYAGQRAAHIEPSLVIREV